MYPMRTSCTQVAGTLASDMFLKQTEQGYFDGSGFGCTFWLGLRAEVVGHNWVRWSAAQLSNESALPHTTDSVRVKQGD